jgi:hypothetical protein
LAADERAFLRTCRLGTHRALATAGENNALTTTLKKTPSLR